MSSGRVRDLGLHLLDRQVVGPDGEPVGKVDDVEINDEGFVIAILVGPHAVAGRLRGLLGEWLTFWSAALARTSTSQPTRIGMELVTDFASVIAVARSRGELGAHRNEDRVREHLIERLPGAHRAGE